MVGLINSCQHVFSHYIYTLRHSVYCTCMCFNVMVHIIIVDSISEGRDFIFIDQTVPWDVSNPVNPPEISVTIIDDDIVEHNESFTLLLSISANGLNIDTSIADLQLTIKDNGKYTHQ